MKGRDTRVESSFLLLLGAVFMIAALFFAFTIKANYSGVMKSLASLRGAMLVFGAVLFFIGLYRIPSTAHHRKIVYFLFLFPLLPLSSRLFWESAIPLRTGPEFVSRR